MYWQKQEEGKAKIYPVEDKYIKLVIDNIKLPGIYSYKVDSDWSFGTPSVPFTERRII